MKHIANLICIVTAIAVLTITWQQSLPNWCANPDVGGNNLVQPFCGE